MTTDAVPRMRASDAERTATIEALQDAMARGLLTHEEGDERMAATFVVRFRDELPPLTADLPQAEAAGRKAAATTSWRGLVTALVTLIRGEIAATVAAGFRSRRFLVTALIALAVLAGLVLVIGHGFADGGPGHFAGRDGR
jgi:Domain of unknown function (DUF1707)